jgi:hypothetical protein
MAPVTFRKVTLDTPAIVGFAGTDMVFDVPPECLAVEGLCLFKIAVDSTALLAESNESNNNVVGQCSVLLL